MIDRTGDRQAQDESAQPADDSAIRTAPTAEATAFTGVRAADGPETGSRPLLKLSWEQRVTRASRLSCNRVERIRRGEARP